MELGLCLNGIAFPWGEKKVFMKIEQLFTAYKAAYNLKGKTIMLEKLYNENKEEIEMKLNQESNNKRLLVKYKEIGFWLSYSGKITIFGAKEENKQKVKLVLLEFYNKIVKNHILESNKALHTNSC